VPIDFFDRFANEFGRKFGSERTWQRLAYSKFWIGRGQWIMFNSFFHLCVPSMIRIDVVAIVVYCLLFRSIVRDPFGFILPITFDATN
jgi:hypothetical protein